jgi:hypothetical protein
MMVEHCTNERLAMTLHSIANASMIDMAGAQPSASQNAWTVIPQATGA